jgi:hypothetical protein
MKPKRKREFTHILMSKGNVRDLIVPFLYQTKVLKPSDEVEDLVLDLITSGDTYSVYIYKKGGVKDSKELCKGDAL